MPVYYGVTTPNTYRDRGPWDASTYYSVNDVVALNKEPYICVTEGQASDLGFPTSQFSALLVSSSSVASPGNRLSCISDSILGSTIAQSQATHAQDLVSWATFLSNGRFVVGTNAGVSGETSAQLLARIDTDIISPNVTDILGILCGTNDASTGVPVATFLANVTSMVDKAQKAGMVPFLFTPPPNPAGAQRLLSAKYCLALRFLAKKRRLNIVPLREVWIDPTTGGYISALDNGDGIHPNNAGRKIGGQAIVDTLTSTMPSAAVNTALFATTDSPNLLPNALFLVDTNADGTPDSWTKTGATIIPSIVSGSGDGIRGNWLRIQDTGNVFGQVVPAAISGANFTVGDRIAVSCRFKSAITSGSALFGIVTVGGGLNWRPVQLDRTTGVGHAYMEVVVPSGTTSINISYSGSGTAMDFFLGEPMVVNLTAMGIS